jgi:hypothetical protein
VLVLRRAAISRLTRCRCPTLHAVPSKSRENPYKLSDNGGPYLLVEKNGSKLWRHAYRFDGRQKLIALNREARFERAEALGRSAYKIVYALKIEGVIGLEGDRLPLMAPPLTTLANLIIASAVLFVLSPCLRGTCRPQSG